jgi:hypothetical protein
VKRRRVGLVSSVIGVVLVVGIVVLVVELSGGHGSGAPRPGHKNHPTVAAARCPLTDLPPAGHKVPNRPAIAVKIGNEPVGARPQSGLNEADIVYDTPAEGFIMRYMAVYQCNSASAIGPDRSVRWVDWHILEAFSGRPILAFAGGITPDVSTVERARWLQAADLLGAQQQAAYRTSTRVPPDNLYTSTGALWSLFKGRGGAPKPVFAFSAKLPPGGRRVHQLAIDFSPGTDAEWTWDGAAGLFLHSYSGVADVDALTGKQVSTDNVVVEVVHYHFGPYPESPGSTGDVESQLTGSGKGWVLRDGYEFPVTWHRPAASDATTFTGPSGTPVALSPGRTFVEIVLNTIAATKGAVTFTP